MDPELEMMLNNNCIDQVFFWVSVSGWMLKPNWSSMTKFVYRCHRNIAVCWWAGAVITNMVALPEILRLKKYDMLFSIIQDFVSIFGSALSISIFISSSRHYRRLNETLKGYPSIHVAGSERFAFKYSPRLASAIFRKFARLSSQVSGLLLTFTFFLMAFLGFFPVFGLLSAYPNIDLKTQRLPFDSSTYGLDKETYFWLLLPLQLILQQTIIGGGLTTPWLTLPSVCMLIQGQITILARTLESIPDKNSASTSELQQEGTSLSCVPANLSESILPIKFCQNEKKLKDCIQHHQMILRCLKLLKRIAGPPLFVNLLTGCIFATTGSVVASGQAGSDIKIFGLVGLSLMPALAFTIWHLMEIRAMVTNISFSAYSLQHKLPGLWKECSVMMHRANHAENFPAVITRSLKMKSLYKVLDLSFNYFVLCTSFQKK